MKNSNAIGRLIDFRQLLSKSSRSIICAVDLRDRRILFVKEVAVESWTNEVEVGMRTKTRRGS